ncbi:Hypothetical protein NGAL_HAMBI1146_58470 [Neorhizobium galegae bv. officinalis]|nr:Hypothetical protein NGAL_HAMBI1146_58470 [Neorhizobium galegae bv. officinalis]
MEYSRVPCEGRPKEIAVGMMLAGQAQGFIPADRSPLTGHEELILARQPTHDGYLNVGVAVFYPPQNSDCLWLDILYVAPEFRRRGVGRELVSQVRQIAAEGGYAEFSIGTMLNNAPMLALLKSIGLTRGLVYFDERCGSAA